MDKPSVRVKFNRKAFKELRQSPRVRADLKRRADAVAQQASESGRVSGYKVTELTLEDPRGAVSVMATGHARAHNRKTRALVRSLDAARN